MRAFKLLRPIEEPVRPCSVPRDAKVFIAAPALDPTDPAVGGQINTFNINFRLLYNQIVINVNEWYKSEGRIKIFVLMWSGHYKSKHVFTLETNNVS